MPPVGWLWPSDNDNNETGYDDNETDNDDNETDNDNNDDDHGDDNDDHDDQGLDQVGSMHSLSVHILSLYP